MCVGSEFQVNGAETDE